MAELLSPGVFIEEVPSTTNIVQPVSTSNMGIVGWTPQGPTDVATFVTSFNQFVATFGNFDSRSFVAYAMAAFFFNGGSTSYVVRVTPTDAQVASGIAGGLHVNQLIETGDGTTATFTETGSTTTLKVASGAAPIQAGQFSVEYRALATTVTGAVAVQRDQATPLEEATGVLSYEGAIDPFQSVATGAGNAELIFRSVTPGIASPAITVTLATASSTGTGAAASVSSFTTPNATITGLTGMTANAVGGYITFSGASSSGNNGTFLVTQFISATSVVVHNTGAVAPDTNNGAITWTLYIPSVTVVTSAITAHIVTGTQTAAQVAALINASPAASALIATTFGGTGAGTPTTAGPLTLVGGLPAFDDNLDAVLVGSLTIHWTFSSSPTSIAFTGLTTEPFQTATNGAGSTAILDVRSGRFSLLINSAEAPASGDNGSPFTVDYHPASATITLTADTTINAQGNMGILGTQLTGGGTATSALSNPPTGIQSYVNVNTGAYNLAFQAGAGNVPHNKAKLLATYTTSDWVFKPISAGVWGNNVSVQIQGSPNYFTTSTQTYARFTALVLVTNPSTLVTTVAEQYEDLVWTDPTNTLFFADVINEFSALISVVEPGGDEGPPQLNGTLNSVVLAGGDDSNGGRVVTGTLVGHPVAPFTVTIKYTDSLGTARTITDDGNGNLIGDVDPTFVGGSTINYTTGAYTFETVAVAGSLGIKAATLVVATYYSAPSVTTDTVPFTGGTDGTFDSTHFGRGQFTSPALQPSYSGLYALDRVEDLMQVVVPDFAGDVTVTDDLLDYADAHAASPSGGDRFIVLNTPRGLSSQQAVSWFRNSLGRFSDFAALYWPWVNIADPLTGRTKLMPVVGHVCGIYARTDSTRNVGKAPGGTVDGQLQFLTSLETNPTQGDRNLVYPNKINPLISSPQTGMAVWGVRTISIDPQWLYINARRLFMFLEKSIYNSTFWIVFENNGPGLWARIKTQVQGFLLNLFNNQYFAGASPAQAFFVICDNTNNTPESIAAGTVVIDVGIAPNKPAEFVVFRFQQITSG